jgi:hypothetical protein
MLGNFLLAFLVCAVVNLSVYAKGLLLFSLLIQIIYAA